MSQDRGSFLIDDTCPECELTRGKHEVWCSAYDPEPGTGRRVPGPPSPHAARGTGEPPATGKE
jgi:hypothetical protein